MGFNALVPPTLIFDTASQDKCRLFAGARHMDRQVQVVNHIQDLERATNKEQGELTFVI